MRQSKQLGVAFLLMVPVALVMAEVFCAFLFLIVGVLALKEEE